MQRRLRLNANEGRYTCCIQPNDKRCPILNDVYIGIMKRLGKKYGSYSFSACINATLYAVTLTQGPVSVLCRLMPVDSGTVITVSWQTFVNPPLVYVTDVPDHFSYSELLLAMEQQSEILTSEHIMKAKHQARARMFTILKAVKSSDEQTTFDLDKNLLAICEYVIGHPKEFARSHLRSPLITGSFDGELWVLWGRVFEDGVWLFCHPSTKSFADPIFIPRHFDEKVSVRFPPNAPWKQIAALLAHVG